MYFVYFYQGFDAQWAVCRGQEFLYQTAVVEAIAAQSQQDLVRRRGSLRLPALLADTVIIAVSFIIDYYSFHFNSLFAFYYFILIDDYGCVRIYLIHIVWYKECNSMMHLNFILYCLLNHSLKLVTY